MVPRSVLTFSNMTRRCKWTSLEYRSYRSEPMSLLGHVFGITHIQLPDERIFHLFVISEIRTSSTEGTSGKTLQVHFVSFSYSLNGISLLKCVLHHPVCFVEPAPEPRWFAISEIRKSSLRPETLTHFRASGQNPSWVCHFFLGQNPVLIRHQVGI